jgi:hypothetical protein
VEPVFLPNKDIGGPLGVTKFLTVWNPQIVRGTPLAAQELRYNLLARVCDCNDSLGTTMWSMLKGVCPPGLSMSLYDFPKLFLNFIFF